VKRNAGRQRRFPPAVPQPRPEDVDLELILLALVTPGGYQRPVPLQFGGAGSRGKSYCPACDLVLRGAGTCPLCAAEAVPMPKSWRPGRKGHRSRVWDVRVSRRRYGRGYAVPEAVRRLGVKGLPPGPDLVHQAIARRGIAQRARYRRNRPAP